MRRIGAGMATVAASLAMALLVAGGVADAQLSGPSLALGTSAAEPGARVTVTFDGFESRSATLSVCGNRAARGSGDCNMVESQGVRLRHMDVTLVHEMTVTPPPVDCPCVIRAVGSDGGEVAIAPIDLVGHPTSAVVEPDLGTPLVDVEVVTKAATVGLAASLRSSLGGGSSQEATVRVRNRATAPVSDVTVHGQVLRNGTTVAEFDLRPGEIGPGQTWTGTAEVELPAPTIGTYDWEVTASGAGPVMETSTTSRSIPWLLLLLILVLVADVVAVVVRAVARSRDRRATVTDDDSGRTPAPVALATTGASAG